eukprot:5915811-Prymnesium_polylepis.1
MSEANKKPYEDEAAKLQAAAPMKLKDEGPMVLKEKQLEKQLPKVDGEPAFAFCRWPRPEPARIPHPARAAGIERGDQGRA